MIEKGPQFQPKVQSFQTVNPSGLNSTYQRLPDNRWVRNKTATGETHVQDTTRFVHPNYNALQPHPTPGVNGYSPLGLALAHGDLLHPSGRIQGKIVNNDGTSQVFSVPEEHISNEPQEGWIPVEHSTDEAGNITSYHMGHPVAPLDKSSFRS